MKIYLFFVFHWVCLCFDAAMLDPRHVQALLTTLNEGGVGKAAERLGLSQPAVSLQLQALERSLGVPVLHKQGRRLLPTAAGKRLADIGQKLLAQWIQLEESLMPTPNQLQGEVALGAVDAAALYTLPACLRAFCQTHPHVALGVTISDSSTLLHAVAAGTIQMAVVVGLEGLQDDPHNQLKSLVLQQDHLVPVVDPNHPLAQKAAHKPLEITELHDIDMLAYPQGSRTRQIVDAIWAQHKTAPKPIMEVSSPEAMRQMCQAGLGVALLPSPLAEQSVAEGSLAVLPLVDASVSHSKNTEPKIVTFRRDLILVRTMRLALAPAAQALWQMLSAQHSN